MREQTKKIIEKNRHSARAGKIIYLTHEKLSLADYQWLAETIKPACFLETILLPEIPENNAEKILSLLEVATRNCTSLRKMNIHFADGAKISRKAQKLQQQIHSRLTRNEKQIFGIHGGGNIGLGLMADIVTRSPHTYRVMATSNKQLSRMLVNSAHQLWLQHGDDEATRVTNVELISRESEDIIRLYTEASIAALCITPAIMPTVAKDIASALIKRYEQDGSGLKILILMNLPNNAQFVMEAVSKELLAQTNDEDHVQRIISVNEFVPSVIDRIVTPINDEIIMQQLRKQLNKIEKYRLWLHFYTADVEKILADPIKLSRAVITFNLKFNLFNAEKKFSMYVNEDFSDSKRFPQMDVTHDLAVIEAVKNKYINGPHAILAWLGALYGYKTIAQSIQHPHIFQFIKELMEKEIAPILKAEYPELTKDELRNLEHAFLERCAASTEDPVTRVGRDPMRKLDQGGRIRGTLEIAQKHGLNLSTARLEQGMAAGFMYAIKNIDPDNQESQKIREIYKKNGKLVSAVLCYKGEAPSGTFTGLDNKTDYSLIFRVQTMIHHINQWLHHRKENKNHAPLRTHKIPSVTATALHSDKKKISLMPKLPVNDASEMYPQKEFYQPRFPFWQAKVMQAESTAKTHKKMFGIGK